MKTKLTIVLALALPSALSAGSFERDLSVNAAALRSNPSNNEEIKPARVEGLGALLRLLFTPGGDLQVDGPAPAAPAVDGELQDDAEAETYEPGRAYEQLRQDDATAAPGGRAGGAQVPPDLLRKAREFLESNASRVGNRNFLGVIDFSQHSSRQRFYIVDLRTNEVRAIRVAHGRGSDADHDGFATTFSNTANSNASSLGFYMTGDTYTGKHGKSMRLHGLSSTNSNALSRAVVIHEADYVQEANVKQGRSFGCPAVAPSEIEYVLSALRGGAIIYGGLANSDY